MKKFALYACLLLLFSLLPSCGLLEGLGQTGGRTIQSLGRTIF
jgi:predicted small secreted protein